MSQVIALVTISISNAQLKPEVKNALDPEIASFIKKYPAESRPDQLQLVHEFAKQLLTTGFPNTISNIGENGPHWETVLTHLSHLNVEDQKRNLDSPLEEPMTHSSVQQIKDYEAVETLRGDLISYLKFNFPVPAYFTSSSTHRSGKEEKVFYDEQVLDPAFKTLFSELEEKASSSSSTTSVCLREKAEEDISAIARKAIAALDKVLEELQEDDKVPLGLQAPRIRAAELYGQLFSGLRLKAERAGWALHTEMLDSGKGFAGFKQAADFNAPNVYAPNDIIIKILTTADPLLGMTPLYRVNDKPIAFTKETEKFFNELPLEFKEKAKEQEEGNWIGYRYILFPEYLINTHSDPKSREPISIFLMKQVWPKSGRKYVIQKQEADQFEEAIEEMGNNHGLFHEAQSLRKYVTIHPELALRMTPTHYKFKNDPHHQELKKKRARDLLQILADKGVVQAQYELAKMYRTGEGGKQDLEKAKHYADQAAAQGFTRPKAADNAPIVGIEAGDPLWDSLPNGFREIGKENVYLDSASLTRPRINLIRDPEPNPANRVPSFILSDIATKVQDMRDGRRICQAAGGDHLTSKQLEALKRAMSTGGSYDTNAVAGMEMGGYLLSTDVGSFSTTVLHNSAGNITTIPGIEGVTRCAIPVPNAP